MKAGLITVLLLLFGLSSVALAAPGPASAPSCAAGPTTIGDTTWGTACSDVIVAPPGVETVHGGGGNDTIVPAPIAASAPCPDGCHLGVGSQTFDGGPGDDVVYGERGNDRLNGGEGNDHLFGGIGDDVLRGGPGNDQLSGGFGGDSIDGEAGDDYVRGDATADKIFDSGGGTDTLSYATGVTPGFTKGLPSSYAGFPSSSGERGAYIDLGKGEVDNGVAPSGGGVDTIEAGSSFEKVIGTPFSDYIVGSAANETIYGGGGADVILGEGGDDTLYGGADGDDLDGGSGTNALDGGAGTDHCQGAGGTSCESATKEVVPRDPSKVSVGFIAPEEPGYSRLYLSGSDAGDEVTATYAVGAPATVSFELGAGSFDQSASAAAGCSTAATTATCTVDAPLDAVVLAGMGGGDTLRASNFPDAVSVVAAGGEGNDSITGGNQSEDVLADGPGDDTLEALGGDDALLNNGGKDKLFGGEGNDLFLSNSICDGDLLDGGGGEYRDNASWAKFQTSGVEARLDEGHAGRPGAGGLPDCGGGPLDALQGIEDLEGTPSHGDVFYGGAGPNQLLGWGGSDSYFSGAGDDTILANSGDADPVIDCGDGTDIALVDHPEFGDATPVNCESVQEADPNSFRPEIPPPSEVPGPSPEVPEPAAGGRPPSPAAKDTTPPRTTITSRPRKLSISRKRRLKVIFRFGSNESGASFRCRLDRGTFKACSSPRAYLVASGRHTVRIVAVDDAGNSDPSPALFGFRVRRR